MPTTQVTNPETKVISEQNNNMLLLCETDTYLTVIMQLQYEN